MRAVGAILAGVIALATPVSGQDLTGGFAVAVDEAGSIRLPDVDFRAEWTLLGSWIVGGGEDVGTVQGAAGIHQTYTQPDAVDAYRRTGEFPNGTVLVKELLGAQTQPMTTGVVSHASELEGWFVMVKDSQARFADGPNGGLWGEGWGWAYFAPDSPTRTSTKNYAQECLTCHIPARNTDWVYVWGYPVLQGSSVR